MELDKQEWLADVVSDFMYDNGYLDYAEAMDMALRLWDDLVESEEVDGYDVLSD